MSSNTNQWPQELSYRAFKKFSPASDEWVYKTVYSLRSHQISIQNQRIGLEKLGSILRATFKLSASRGFEAMSLRELSKESGISMGGLYAYIGSKEELANLIEHVLGAIVTDLIDLAVVEVNGIKEKLSVLICSHLYLSEQLQPWFYFVYMESKSLSKAQKEKAKQTELAFEQRIAKILTEGIQQGIYKPTDVQLAASTLMALLQDWHLKRWKHRKREITPDQYAHYILGVASAAFEIKN